jgi:cell division protease FtsH
VATPLVALNVPASDPIHKATIIPRGRALGMVMRLPEKDQVSLTRAKCYADLAVAMGGRVARRRSSATRRSPPALRRHPDGDQAGPAMATQFGMSDKLGPLLYGENQQEVFLGHSVAQNQSVSEATQQLVDEEVKAFVEQGYQTAKKILDNIDQLHTIANGLLEYETLSGDEIKGCWMASRRCAKTSTIRRAFAWVGCAKRRS